MRFGQSVPNLAQSGDIVRLELAIKLVHVAKHVGCSFFELVPVLQIDASRICRKVVVESLFHLERKVYKPKKAQTHGVQTRLNRQGENKSS